MNDPYIKKIFGEEVAYIEYDGSNGFLTGDTILSIYYEPHVEIPVGVITLREYIQQVDAFFNAHIGVEQTK